MATRVTGPGVESMRALAIELQAADPALKAALRKNLRDAARPVTNAVKQAALDMPAEKYREGLREEIAATVGVSSSVTKTGVRVSIRALGTRMPAGKEHLPVFTDRGRGWGHPVFADRSKPRDQWTWVRQHGDTGWFEHTVIGRYEDFRRAVESAIADVARALARK